VERRLRRSHWIEIISRVQRIVPEIVEKIAMELVLPALGHDVDHRTGVPPIFGLEVGQNFQFVHRIDRQNSRRRAEHSRFVDRGIVPVAVVHVRAVQQKVIRPSTRPIH